MLLTCTEGTQSDESMSCAEIWDLTEKVCLHSVTLRPSGIPDYSQLILDGLLFGADWNSDRFIFWNVATGRSKLHLPDVEYHDLSPDECLMAAVVLHYGPAGPYHPGQENPNPSLQHTFTLSFIQLS